MEIIGNTTICNQIKEFLKSKAIISNKINKNRRKRRRYLVFDLSDGNEETYFEIIKGVNTGEIIIDKSKDVLVGILTKFNEDKIKSIPPNFNKFEIPYYTVCIDPQNIINFNLVFF